MSTTLEVYAGKRLRSYCTRPTIDVEILPDVHTCEVCGGEVAYDLILGRWTHTRAIDHPERTVPLPRCTYCHSTDDLTIHHRAYADTAECSRCGGVDGFAIGD